jgi:hypothetical protein
MVQGEVHPEGHPEPTGKKAMRRREHDENKKNTKGIQTRD